MTLTDSKFWVKSLKFVTHAISSVKTYFTQKWENLLVNLSNFNQYFESLWVQYFTQVLSQNVLQCILHYIQVECINLANAHVDAGLVQLNAASNKQSSKMFSRYKLSTILACEGN